MLICYNHSIVLFSGFLHRASRMKPSPIAQSEKKGFHSSLSLNMLIGIHIIQCLVRHSGPFRRQCS